MRRDLDDRLLDLACRAVDVFEVLTQRGGAARELARQYLRASTSVGANYAEAAAGQTKPDFIAKVSVARKECREVLFWLELMKRKRLMANDDLERELGEVRQIAAILTAIVRNARLSGDRRGPQT